MRQATSRFGAVPAMMLSAAALCLPLAIPALFPDAGPRAAADDEASEPKLDRLVLSSGREVFGEIVEEHADRVVIMVHFKNLPPVKTSYRRSEVLVIERGVADPSADPDAARDSRVDSDDEDDAAEPIDPDAARIVVVELEGMFGSAISETPLNDIFEHVDDTFDDLVEERTPQGETRVVVDPDKRDKHIVIVKYDSASDPRIGTGSLFRAEDIGPIFEREIHDKGRRVVFWIEEAKDGASLIPFLSPEIYFTSDGVLSNTFDFETYSTGDKMVDEKLISANRGHAHGFAIDGGYGENGTLIIDALLRSSNWLAYRWEGGQAQLMNREPTDEEIAEGWIVLSDDGKGDNEDTNKLREFNDQLVMDAELAQKLGISKGTVDSLADLMFELGVHRNYAVIDEDEGQRVVDKWQEALDRAFDQINRTDGRLWMELERIEVAGDFADRRAARGQRIRILRQMRSIFTRFAEAWDPGGRFRAQIDVMINELQQAQQLDTAAQRAGR